MSARHYKAEEILPNDNHHNDGGHFYHGQTELNFTRSANCGEVCQRNQPDRDQCRYPLRHIRNQN